MVNSTVVGSRLLLLGQEQMPVLGSREEVLSLCLEKSGWVKSTIPVQEKSSCVKRRVTGFREIWLGQEYYYWVKRRVAGSREEWQGQEKGGWVRKVFKGLYQLILI